MNLTQPHIQRSYISRFYDGIHSSAVARCTTNAKGLYAIKTHKICQAEGVDIRVLVLGAPIEFKHTVGLIAPQQDASQFASRQWLNSGPIMIEPQSTYRLLSGSSTRCCPGKLCWLSWFPRQPSVCPPHGIVLQDHSAQSSWSLHPAVRPTRTTVAG